MSAPAAPTATADRRQRLAAGICATIALVGAVLVLVQATLAGHLLTGNLAARALHQVLGTDVLMSLLLAQLLAAIAVGSTRGGPWWPAVVTGVLWPVFGFQIGAGFEGRVAVHVPLGVTLLLAELAIAALLWRQRRAPAVAAGRSAPSRVVPSRK